jgi:hypothetical protein
MIAYTRSDPHRATPPAHGPAARLDHELSDAQRLARLGLPPVLARMFADVVDTRQVEALVERGCELGLALRIAR